MGSALDIIKNRGNSSVGSSSTGGGVSALSIIQQYGNNQAITQQPTATVKPVSTPTKAPKQPSIYENISSQIGNIVTKLSNGLNVTLAKAKPVISPIADNQTPEFKKDTAPSKIGLQPDFSPSVQSSSALITPKAQQKITKSVDTVKNTLKELGIIVNQGVLDPVMTAFPSIKKPLTAILERAGNTPVSPIGLTPKMMENFTFPGEKELAKLPLSIKLGIPVLNAAEQTANTIRFVGNLSGLNPTIANLIMAIAPEVTTMAGKALLKRYGNEAVSFIANKDLILKATRGVDDLTPKEAKAWKILNETGLEAEAGRAKGGISVTDISPKKGAMWDLLRKIFPDGFTPEGTPTPELPKMLQGQIDDMAEQLAKTEYSPGEVIDMVSNSPLKNTPDGKELIKAAVKAQQTGENIIIASDVVKPSTGGEIRFSEGGDSIARGQYDGYINAVDNKGNVIGRVDYSTFNGETQVKMIEVKPEYKRQGVGTKLLEKLQADNKTPIKIQGDFATPEGQALFNKFQGKSSSTGGEIGGTNKKGIVQAGNTYADLHGVDPEQTITVYRGVKESQHGKLSGGEWVTQDKELARLYSRDRARASGENARIISQKVKAKDLIIDPSTNPGVDNEFRFQPSTGGEIGGITLYHGSDKVFDEMKVGQPTKRRMMMGEYDTTSHGMFFTPDKKIAGEYGKNVGEYRVNVKNPLDFRDRKNDAIFNEFDKLIANDPTIDIKPGEPGFSEFMYFDGELGKKFTQFIKSKGFDGAKLKETSEFSKGDFDTIVALDNAQVKSIKPSSGEIQKENKFAYTPSTTLTPEKQAIEAKFASEIEKDLPGMMQKYEEKFGKVINTDNFRELSPDYEANRQENSAAVHEPASELAKLKYKQELAKPIEKDSENLVLFTAGGTGSGKTTAIQKTEDGKQLWDSAQIIYDTNLNSAPSAIKKIDQALEAGRRVGIAFVYRDPIEAFENGVIPRTERIGRTVPINSHIETHMGMQRSISELMEHYKDNPNVEFTGFDNSKGKGNQEIVPIENLLGKVYNEAELRKGIYDTLNKAYQQGKVTESAYKGFTGENPPERINAGDSKGNVAEPTDTRREEPSIGQESNVFKAGDVAKERLETLKNTPPTEGTPEPPGPLPPGKGISRLQERLQEQLLDMDPAKYSFDPQTTTYDKIALETNAGAALDLLEKNPQKALRIARGLDPYPATTKEGATGNSISLAVALKALDEGNIPLFNEVVNKTTLRSSRFGQEIVSLRGQFNDNTPQNYIKRVLDARLDDLGKSLVSDAQKELGLKRGTKAKAAEKIDREVEKLSARMKVEKSRIQMAQDVIDSLICK